MKRYPSLALRRFCRCNCALFDTLTVFVVTFERGRRREHYCLGLGPSAFGVSDPVPDGLTGSNFLEGGVQYKDQNQNSAEITYACVLQHIMH